MTDFWGVFRPIFAIFGNFHKSSPSSYLLQFVSNGPHSLNSNRSIYLLRLRLITFLLLPFITCCTGVLHLLVPSLWKIDFSFVSCLPSVLTSSNYASWEPTVMYYVQAKGFLFHMLRLMLGGWEKCWWPDQTKSPFEALWAMNCALLWCCWRQHLEALDYGSPTLWADSLQFTLRLKRCCVHCTRARLWALFRHRNLLRLISS